MKLIKRLSKADLGLVVSGLVILAATQTVRYVVLSGVVLVVGQQTALGDNTPTDTDPPPPPLPPPPPPPPPAYTVGPCTLDVVISAPSVDWVIETIPTAPCYGQLAQITFTPMNILGKSVDSLGVTNTLTPSGNYHQFTETIIVPYQSEVKLNIDTPFSYSVSGDTCEGPGWGIAHKTISLNPVVCMTPSPSSADLLPCSSDRPDNVSLSIPNLEVDSDGDGLSDLYELTISLTYPGDSDSDGDSIPDGWEVMHGFDPDSTSDAASDLDSDGLTNVQEYQHGSDPRNPDTDGDGLTDGTEVSAGWNPTRADTNGDGIPDGWKASHGLDPLVATNSLQMVGSTGMTYWDLWLAGAESSTVIEHLYVAPQGATYSSIQAAIDAVPISDSGLYVIHVAPGTYAENLIITNRNWLMILGTNATSTILSGTANNQPAVSATEFVSLNLRGITIRDGQAEQNGGGIMADSSNGTLRVSNCIITDNTAQGSGGGIWCRVLTNQSVELQMTPAIVDTESAGSNAILQVKSSASCTGSTPAQVALGWVLPSDRLCAWQRRYTLQAATLPSSAIFNCIIADNQATTGSAVCVESGGVGLLHDTVVSNRLISTQGSAVCAPSGASATMVNSILWRNAGQDVENVVVHYSILNSNQTVLGEGNFSADPHFISPFLRNYHLRSDSLARAKAWPSKIIDDLDRELRQTCTNETFDAEPATQCGDIGADHYLDVDDDGLPDSWENQYGITDAGADPDDDKLSSLQEFSLGTNPSNPDTDGDGYMDFQETLFGTDPLDANSTPPFPPNLVAWWELNEDTGTLTADSSGNGNDGTVTSGTWTSGISQAAVQLDGAPYSSVSAPASASLDSSNALTVAAWVKTTNDTARVVASYRAAEVFSGWRMFYSTTGILFQWNADDGTGYRQLPASGSFPSNQWVHVAAVFGLDDVRLYLNGVQVASQTTDTGTNLTLTANYPVGLGEVYNANHYAFPGQIDEVQIYSRALGSDEIDELYSMDTDGDGLLNVTEVNVRHTDPNSPDTDGDGMPDGWEVQYLFNPLNPDDASQDANGNGLSNLEEYLLDTNPRTLYLHQLVGWWALDELDGLTAVDSSGLGTDGTLLNMDQSDRVLGYVRSGLTFNGADTAVKVPWSQFSALGAVSNEIGMAAWVNLHETGLNGRRTIFSLGSETNGDAKAGAVLAVTNGFPVFTVLLASGPSAPFVLASTNALPTNEWHHVLGVYSASHEAMVLYVDGVQAGMTESNAFSVSVLNGGDSYIGALATDVVTEVFSGVLDEVRLYNTALSAQTAAALAQSSPMVGWWMFDETDEFTAVDYSGQGDHGNLLGMDINNRIDGYIGNGLQFDGNATAVDVANSAASPLSTVANEFSIAAWIRPTNDVTGVQTIFSLGSAEPVGQAQVGGILALTNRSPILTVFLASAPETPLTLTCTSTLPTNEWHHVVGVYSASGQSMTLYVDGTQVALDNALLEAGPVRNAGHCYIGSLATNGLEEVFSGTLDDVRLYRQALSAAAVTNLFAVQQSIQQLIQSQQTTQAQIDIDDILQTQVDIQAPEVTGESQAAVATDWMTFPWSATPTNETGAVSQFPVDPNASPPTVDVPPVTQGNVSFRDKCGL